MAGSVRPVPQRQLVCSCWKADGPATVDQSAWHHSRPETQSELLYVYVGPSVLQVSILPACSEKGTKGGTVHQVYRTERNHECLSSKRLNMTRNALNFLPAYAQMEHTSPQACCIEPLEHQQTCITASADSLFKQLVLV